MVNHMHENNRKEGLVSKIFLFLIRPFLVSGVRDMLQKMSPFGSRLFLGSLAKKKGLVFLGS